jgi:hypothetical protein
MKKVIILLFLSLSLLVFSPVARADFWNDYWGGGYYSHHRRGPERVHEWVGVVRDVMSLTVEATAAYKAAEAVASAPTTPTRCKCKK